MDSFNPGGLASLSRSETTSCAQQEECATRLPQAHADMPEDGDDVNMLQVTGQGELRDDIEVRTQPRGATFIKTAGDMPSSSNAKAQLWESGASSGSSTLVGTYGRDQVVGHIRTISGSSSARKSRLSSSNSHEAVEPISRAIPEVRGSAPTRDSFSQSGAVDSPRDDTPSLTVRQTPRSAEERHRSFPTTRLQPRPQTHRQSHASQSSIPPLSPLMPLIFQPDLPLAMVAYASRLARILHAIYPILYFGHVPITLFLDFNILYALIQIAAHPEYGGQGDEFGYIQASPRVNPWWIAVGFYALSTMTWFVVVLILHDLYYFHFKVWNNRNPSIIKIFTAAPSFHISCTRSFNLFSALWRLRLSALTGIGSLPPSRHQAGLETAQMYMQNWPTLTTLVPRAALSLLLLVSFTSANPRDSTATASRRDFAYFRPDGTLSTYNLVCNLINLCWAVWRCLVALTAGLVYLYLRREGNRSTRSPRILTPRDSYTIVSVTCPTNLQEAGTCAEWKRNLHERVLELVLMCSSAGRWRISKDDLAAYHRSRSARPEGARARRQRRSTVAFQNRVDARSDMEERSSSNLSFNVCLPATSPFASQNGGLEHDGAAREIRISSIPTRRTKAISNNSTVNSLFSVQVDTGDSNHTLLERPFSALGQYSQQTLHARGHSGTTPPQTPIVEEIDEEERERLDLEKLAPLTPRGSLVQAREELAHQQKQRSYWTSGPSNHMEDAVLGDVPTSPADIGHAVERDLHAIVEESDEEASLRRANSLSNRQTISSRQSSLRRAPTPLNRREDGTISVIEERSEHGQTASAG